MADAFVEITKKPLMGWRQDDDVAAGSNELRGQFDLPVVVFNMFKHIDVEDAVKMRLLGKVTERADNHLCRWRCRAGEYSSL